MIYTGAGAGAELELVNIRFREKGSDLWIQHATDVQLTASPYTRHIWYALLLSEQFAVIEDVEFSVTTQNPVSKGITMTANQLIGMYYAMLYITCTH